METPKRILIVDDEAAVLTVLKNSLSKFDYQVITAEDGFTALEQLQRESFDLVVTDYQMVGMNGIELLEAIRAIRPEAQVILITAYGTDSIEVEAQRLGAHHYLPKPLDIDTFRSVVKEALTDRPVKRPGVLILSEQCYEQVLHILELLQTDIGARCLFLADASGRVLARSGDQEELSMSEIVPLIGGSIATLQEVGRKLDGEDEAINLIYREGAHENLYVVNIGHQILLVAMVERGDYTSRLGSVWYYARQTAVALRQILDEASTEEPLEVLLDDEMTQSFDAEIDKLFKISEPFEELGVQAENSLREAVDTGVLPTGWVLRGEQS